jgi:hypothetical protein
MSQSPTSHDRTAADWGGESAANIGGDLVGRPRLLRVSCPRGHTLDAPCTLDGQQVVCPYCGSRFLFSYEKSEQYRHERPLDVTEGPRERRSWIDWFTVAAIAVIIATVAFRRFANLDWP